jgi:hypothetical protein
MLSERLWDSSPPCNTPAGVPSQSGLGSSTFLGLAVTRWASESRAGPDAGQRVHVTFERESAETWTEQTLLGRYNPGGDWVLFQIHRRGIKGKVYRDPASRPGYILEGELIGPDHLSVARRWRTREIRAT